VSWLPDPPIALVLFQKIKAQENLLHDSSELFWYFYLNSMSPEKFKERTEFWIDKQLEDAHKGGGFIDPEIRDNILQGHEKLSQIIIDKLDKLSEEKFVPYHPDEKDDPIALYIYIHIEASRLTQFLKSEQYPERTREVLSNVVNAFNRCNKVIDYLNTPWSQEYSVSLIAVGSFLLITQFWLRKSDGDYEEALKSLFWGFAQNMMASLAFPKNGFPNPNAIALISFINSIGNIWEHAPWMQNLNPQEPVNCFEAIRTGSDNKDLKEVVDICSYFVTVVKNWWPDEEQEIEVKDADGESWSLSEYWQNALGWASAQLTPSKFKEMINEREEQAAEQRLLKYFFGEDLWNKLPGRTKSSLISADRDWFEGRLIRVESILNELKIAIEEILLIGLWNPLNQWCINLNIVKENLEPFLKLRDELISKRMQPDLSHFERLCRFPIVHAFLKNKAITKDRREWFKDRLPNRLAWLRRARRNAEHIANREWTREELGMYYSEFIGIDKRGIILEIARILFL